MICANCSTTLESGARLCGRCGAAAPATAAWGLGRVLKVLATLALSLLAVVVALVLLLLSPGLFFRLLSVGGTVMMVVSVLAMVRTARKAKAVTSRALVVSMAVSLLSAIVYSAVLGLHLGPGVWFGALFCGALVGTGWALTARLRLEGGIVKRDGGWLYLAVWGLLFALSQLFVAATGRAPALAMLPLLLGTGVVVGQSTMLLWGCRRLRKRAGGIAGAFLGLSLLVSAPARAGAAGERTGPDRLPADLIVATLEDAARTLGWTAVVKETDVVWLLAPADVKLGTLAVPFKNCPPPACEPLHVEVFLRRSVSVFKMGFLPEMGGRCGANERRVDVYGMPGCLWSKGSPDQVFWGLQRDGRTVLGFVAFDSHCYSSMAGLVEMGLCDTSQDNVLPLVEAVHQAALRTGLYAAMLPREGAPPAATPAPTAPPPVAIAEEAAPPAPPREPAATRAPQPPAAPRAARRPTRVAPAREAEVAPPVSPEEPPDPDAEAPTPAETAGATVASGLLMGVGAWLFGKANAVGLDQPSGDVASLEEPPRPPPEEPPRHDGEVKGDTGEVWSAEDGGWVSPNLYEQEKAWKTDIARAEEVSRAESRAQSAEISEGLRVSRDLQRAWAEMEKEDARLFEEEAELRAVTVEAYQPGWADRVETGLGLVQKGLDTTMSVLGDLTGPEGQALVECYTVAKETAAGVSEGVGQWRYDREGEISLAGAVARRGAVGLARGVFNARADQVAGEVMNAGMRKLIGHPEGEFLPNLANVQVGSLLDGLRDGAAGTYRVLGDPLGREFATRSGALRHFGGISVGRALVSPEIQDPAKRAVGAITGEKL